MGSFSVQSVDSKNVNSTPGFLTENLWLFLIRKKINYPVLLDMFINEAFSVKADFWLNYLPLLSALFGFYSISHKS